MKKANYGAVKYSSVSVALLSPINEHDQLVLIPSEVDETLTQRRDMILGSALMIVSALFFAVMTGLIQWGNGLGYSSFEMLCYEGAIAVPLTCGYQIAMYFWYTPYIEDNINRSILGWLLLRGLIGGIYIGLYLCAMLLIPANDVLTTISMYPVATAFLASTIFNERLTIMHTISLSICVIGLIMITEPQLFFGIGDNGLHWYGYIVGIAASLACALSYIVIRRCENIPFLWIVQSHNIVCFILGLILTLSTQEFNTIMDDGTGLSVLIGTGLCGFGCQICFTKGAQLISPGLASLLGVSGVFWIYIIQLVFFHQTITLSNVLGALLIIAAIFIICVQKMRNHTTPE